MPQRNSLQTLPEDCRVLLEQDTSTNDDCSSLISSNHSDDFESSAGGQQRFCGACRQPLGKRYLRPRHTCKMCGIDVCSQCSPNVIQLDGQGDKQRVCMECVRPLRNIAHIKQRLVALSGEMAIIGKVPRKPEEQDSIEASVAACERTLPTLRNLRESFDSTSKQTETLRIQVANRDAQLKRQEREDADLRNRLQAAQRAEQAAEERRKDSEARLLVVEKSLEDEREATQRESRRAKEMQASAREHAEKLRASEEQQHRQHAREKLKLRLRVRLRMVSDNARLGLLKRLAVATQRSASATNADIVTQHVVAAASMTTPSSSLRLGASAGSDGSSRGSYRRRQPSVFSRVANFFRRAFRPPTPSPRYS